MYRVKTLNKIAKVGLSVFDEKYEIDENIENPNGVILRSFNMHDTELPESLSGIARAGAGVNNIPVEKCSEEGIVVFNTPGANANAVKELVVAGLFLASRKIVKGIEWAKTLKGLGDDVSKTVEKGKSNFAGPEIQGKTLGIIGLGAIGVKVANAANALGMNVIGYDPFLSVDAAWHMTQNARKADSIDAVLAVSDYISVHVPLNNDTRGMFNKDTFKKMKKGARLLNFSRGELVNDEDVIAALNEEILSVYVTDFASDAILDCENVIAMPHLGASTPESEDNCAVMAAMQLKNFLENGNIKNSVNFPNCDMGVVTNVRVAVAHKNIPSMLNKISHVFAQENLNIENMTNKSKGDYAYTLIDLSGDFSKNAEKELKSVEGVIKVTVYKA